MRSLIPNNQCSTEVRPLGSLLGFPNDMERVVARFLGNAPAHATSRQVRLDWTETEAEFVVNVELPGVAPEAVEITVTGDVLTLSGEKAKAEGAEEDGPSYSERTFGPFRRDIQLPCAVATERVHAESGNGVVTIHLPKAESVRPKRIEIKGS